MIFTYTKLSSAYAFLRTFQKWLSRRCQHTRKYTHWKWLCSPASRICGFCRVTSGVEQGQYIVYITIFSLNVPFSFLFTLWKEFSQRSRQAHPRQRNHEKGKRKTPENMASSQRHRSPRTAKGTGFTSHKTITSFRIRAPFLFDLHGDHSLTACNCNDEVWRLKSTHSWNRTSPASQEAESRARHAVGSSTAGAATCNCTLYRWADILWCNLCGIKTQLTNASTATSQFWPNNVWICSRYRGMGLPLSLHVLLISDRVPEVDFYLEES